MSVTPDRPSINSVAVRRYAAMRLAEHLRDNASEFVEGSELSEVEDDLFKVLRDYDGYSMARSLESYGWDPDANLVQILDGDWLHAAHRKAIRDWVKAYNIKTDLKVDDWVTFKDSKGTHRGRITRLDTEAAEATVFVPELGHVESGNGTYGRVVAWELLSRADVVNA